MIWNTTWVLQSNKCMHISVVRCYLFSNLDVYPLLIASFEMISWKGLNLTVLSFYFMINCHYLVFPIVSLEYISLEVIWTVKDTAKYQRSRLQTFVVPKKRTLQNICGPKKADTTKHLWSQKSGHYKTFVVSKKRRLRNMCSSKKVDTQKISSFKKADTTKDLQSQKVHTTNHL